MLCPSELLWNEILEADNRVAKSNGGDVRDTGKRGLFSTWEYTLESG